MAQPDMQNSDSFRWWEFYAVRYGMGTVVGGVIFFFLCNTNPALKPMLFGAGIGKIDGPLLALLAGYGLAYCYIASAPILVFHAGRFLLERSRLEANRQRRLSIFRYLLLYGPPIVTTLIFFFTDTSTDLIRYLYTAIVAIAAMVIWPQYFTIWCTLSRKEELFRFYRRLAYRRDAAEWGVVESYKHLREHGNSFSIVVLEMVLALILYIAANFDPTGGVAPKTMVAGVLPYVAIILFWILPAALVWLVGTQLEREFMDA